MVISDITIVSVEGCFYYIYGGLEKSGVKSGVKVVSDGIFSFFCCCNPYILVEVTHFLVLIYT